MEILRVTVWSEGLDVEWEPKAAEIYPNDINHCLAAFLEKNKDMNVQIHSLRETENGLSAEILANTDVLVMWSHIYHHLLNEEAANRVADAVLNGMGLLLLHSAKWGKPAEKLLGRVSQPEKYREIGEKEKIWVVNRAHPICEGLEKEYIEIEKDEMYGEPFGIPTPDELIFLSWFEGGEVLRSGSIWYRGAGKVFYFSPGHEEFPVYYHPEIQKIITNAVRWLKPIASPKVTMQGCQDKKTPLNAIQST